MNRSAQVKFSSKILEKTIKTAIKKAIASEGINVTTRQGNKELKFLIGKIAQYSFDSLEQATTIGEKLGGKIAEISHNQGKQNLDGGVIRQLSHQKELFSLIGLSAEQFQAVEETNTPEQPVSGATPTEEAEAIEESEAEEITPEPEDAAEQPVSEATPAEEITDETEQASEEEIPSAEVETIEESDTEEIAPEAEDSGESSELNEESLIHS